VVRVAGASPGRREAGGEAAVAARGGGASRVATAGGAVKKPLPPAARFTDPFLCPLLLFRVTIISRKSPIGERINKKVMSVV